MFVHEWVPAFSGARRGKGLEKWGGSQSTVMLFALLYCPVPCPLLCFDLSTHSLHSFLFFEPHSLHLLATPRVDLLRTSLLNPTPLNTLSSTLLSYAPPRSHTGFLQPFLLQPFLYGLQPFLYDPSQPRGQECWDVNRVSTFGERISY